MCPITILHPYGDRRQGDTYPPLLYPGIDAGFGWFPGVDLDLYFGGWGGWGWGGWGWMPNWYGGNIFIDHSFFHRYGFRDFGGGPLGRSQWEHNPEHRLGVPYGNRQVASRFGRGGALGGANGRFSGARSRALGRGAAAPQQRFGNRGFEQRGWTGKHSVFGGYHNGGMARSQSDRGFSSIGGGRGGGFRGGRGGGFGGGRGGGFGGEDTAEGGADTMAGKLSILGAAMALASAMPLVAQERFDSAQAAAEAVIDAAEKHDSARLSAIFGPSAKSVLTCGDAAQDRSEQTEFTRLARAKHRLEISLANPNRAILAIGDEDWPFPVPIVQANGKWSFDASETPAEMRARRIGADELDAIEICRGYVEAQMKYASEDRQKDGMLEYADHLMSTPGRHDGLYWNGAPEPLIPAGMAHAAWDAVRNGRAKPYHGYYFRVLEAQGPNAPAGAHNYLAKGKLIGGFGLVAWPADYGVTGVYTFIVNQDGVVYQKDIEPPRASRPYL